LLLGRELVAMGDWPPKDQVDRDPTLYRLNWAIQWYTLAALQARRWYQGLKGVQIVASAAVPVVTVLGGTSLRARASVAGLGALVVVLEGIQQLQKYGQNALLWAQAKEALKRQYFLFKAKVRPYEDTQEEDRVKVLARKIDQIIGQEVARWADEVSPPGADESKSRRTKRRRNPAGCVWRKP
jgi:hypothetical protein